MFKKIVPFLAALPAFILLFFFKIIPDITTVILSMKEFNAIKGILGSPSAGSRYYREAFELQGFTKIAGNTLLLSVLSILLTCLLALVLILCISRIPGRVLKTIAIAILAIPAFIPIAAYVNVFFDAFSLQTGFVNKILQMLGMKPRPFFAVSGAYPLLFMLMDALRNVFVPVIMGVLVYESRNRHSALKKIMFVIIGYMAVRATMLMSPNLELIILTSNQLNSAGSMVVDLYINRASLTTMNFGQPAAFWVIKTIIQLVISIAAYLILYKLSPVITESVGKLGENPIQKPVSIIGIIGYLLFAAGSAAIIVSIFIPASGTMQEIRYLLEGSAFWKTFINTLVCSICGCILYGFMSLMLAYPMTVSRRVYPLILLLISSLTNNIIGEYLQIFNYALWSTAIPPILYSGLTVIGAFALHFSVSCRLKDEHVGYFRAALRPLAVLMALSFITIWGSYYYQYPFIVSDFINELGLFGINIFAAVTKLPGTENMQILNENALSGYIFLASFVPAAIGAILIGLNRFLPLTAYGTHARKG